MQGPFGISLPVKLVAAAFPALQRLELGHVSLNWEDLHALTSCSQLSSLQMEMCALPATATATNPLAALASLKELHVAKTSSLVAKGLAQLTSLCLHSNTEFLSQLIRSLDGMQQLQQLELHGSDYELPAVVVTQLFSAVPQLQGLRLGSIIRQQAFDALLAHATQLTHLTCKDLFLSEDRSQSACSWKELVAAGHCFISGTLTYLPLHSLSRVCLSLQGHWFEVPSESPSLACFLNNLPGSIGGCTPAEMRKALINLGACPAWQASGPSVRIHLVSMLGGPQDIEEYRQVIPALGAVADKKVQLSLHPLGFQVTGDIVEHLGATLGHSLTRLSLPADCLTQSFWPAVWRCLPGLQELRLLGVGRAAISSSDIAAFCSHATRPMSLGLDRSLYHRVGPSEQLEQQCHTWGVPQVTVTEVHGF
jgi:hypothetical protein